MLLRAVERCWVSSMMTAQPVPLCFSFTDVGTNSKHARSFGLCSEKARRIKEKNAAVADSPREVAFSSRLSTTSEKVMNDYL